MKPKIERLLGWYGVAAILTAYALLNFSIISSESLIYLMLNFTGALGIVVVAKSPQPALLNVVWALIALFGIIKFYFVS